MDSDSTVIIGYAIIGTLAYVTITMWPGSLVLILCLFLMYYVLKEI